MSWPEHYVRVCVQLNEKVKIETKNSTDGEIKITK